MKFPTSLFLWWKISGGDLVLSSPRFASPLYVWFSPGSNVPRASHSRSIRAFLFKFNLWARCFVSRHRYSFPRDIPVFHSDLSMCASFPALTMVFATFACKSSLPRWIRSLELARAVHWVLLHNEWHFPLPVDLRTLSHEGSLQSEALTGHPRPGKLGLCFLSRADRYQELKGERPASPARKLLPLLRRWGGLNQGRHCGRFWKFGIGYLLRCGLNREA